MKIYSPLQFHIHEYIFIFGIFCFLDLVGTKGKVSVLGVDTQCTVTQVGRVKEYVSQISMSKQKDKTNPILLSKTRFVHWFRNTIFVFLCLVPR